MKLPMPPRAVTPDGLRLPPPLRPSLPMPATGMRLPLPSLPAAIRVGPRVMAAEDFQRAGEPTLAQFQRATTQLWAEGVRLATVRAKGGQAVDYYAAVMDRAHKIMQARPLPLPPRAALPLPPRPRSLPMPPGA